jgi:hypothetical protein
MDTVIVDGQVEFCKKTKLIFHFVNYVTQFWNLFYPCTSLLCQGKLPPSPFELLNFCCVGKNISKS